MSTETCVGGLWCPTDGYADPSMLTQSLARGARQNGGKIFRDTLVEGFKNDGKRITKVITNQGTIECDTIVNAAGMWARRIGKMAGVNVPLAVIEHQYVVTKEIDGVARDLPVTRDPDKLIYYRPEVGGLIMGGFEHDSILNNHGDVPWDFVSQLYEPNLEQFEKLFVPAKFTPFLETAEVRQMVNGISDKPREIIAAAAGMTSLQEMDRNRSASSCCGAGGGRMWFDDEPETRIGTTRVQEALDTNASTVAVSCPFCLTMMTDGVAAKTDQVQVREIHTIAPHCDQKTC